MNKLKRIFNQNRKIIFKVIIIILVCFILLQLLNYLVGKQNKEKQIEPTTKKDETYDRDYEIISSSRKDSTIYETEKETLQNFLELCNQQDFEKAYSLLTQECKNAVFPNVETFIHEYGEKIFSQKKDYNIQAWTSNIYRIKITENLLEKGSIGESNYIEDYFSVIGDQLNIQSFLDTIKKNDVEEKANVTVQIKQVDIYMDYAVLKVNILNERDTPIMLNSEDYADNVYLKDQKGLKFVAMLHELSQDDFIVDSGERKEISIKFDVPYSKIEEIESFHMDNIICNYEQYQDLGDSRAIQMAIPI